MAIVGSRGYPYVYGGYETFVKEISERLVLNQVEVHVYCQKNLFKNRPEQLNGIHLHYIPTLPHKALNQIIHSLLSMIHVTFSRIDIVLVVNLAAGPLGWLPRLGGKKTIMNTDGLEWQRPKWKGLGSKYFLFGAWCASKLYHGLVSDAEAMRQVYLEKFHTDSTVIAYGAPAFKTQNANALAKFNLAAESYYLIVGRLIPDNNADLLIEEFLKTNSTKKLVVIGDVPYQDDYSTSLKLKASERLIFTGYIHNQDELLCLYQHCFMYLHGHEYGGTNPTMLKAMSNNCAILALNTKFNQEMLNNGQFGSFFDKTPGSLSTQMQLMENALNEVNHLKSVSAKGLTNKYSWEQVTKQYIDLFNNVLTTK